MKHFKPSWEIVLLIEHSHKKVRHEQYRGREGGGRERGREREREDSSSITVLDGCAGCPFLSSSFACQEPLCRFSDAAGKFKHTIAKAHPKKSFLLLSVFVTQFVVFANGGGKVEDLIFPQKINKDVKQE